MVAGLEIIKNMPSNLRHELYYWVREEKNSRSEVDYLEPFNARVLPIEVKAETQGAIRHMDIIPLYAIGDRTEQSCYRTVRRTYRS